MEHLAAPSGRRDVHRTLIDTAGAITYDSASLPPGGRTDNKGDAMTTAGILKCALGAALLLMLAATSEARHHRHRETAADPGEFGYYLLSLSWSPAFCLSTPGSEECNGPRRLGFIVHGLWPQNEQGWPEHCGTDSSVPDAVVQGILDLMPARKLVYHEWSTHGTCSGLDPAAYFATVRRARETVRIPAALASPQQAVEQNPGAIAAAFRQANPRFTPQSVVVTCSGQGAPRLREVHVCLTKELSARDCSAEVLRQACRAEAVIVPPTR
jgi:ribonuclease T2